MQYEAARAELQSQPPKMPMLGMLFEALVFCVIAGLLVAVI